MAESRSVIKLVGVAGVALLALTSGALAGGSLKDEPAPEREFTYSFSITGTSDYVFRGVTQTDGDPTIQGAINIGYGIFYAGIWASGVDFGPTEDADIEADYYAGIKPTWGGATFDFGVIYYDYPGYDYPKNEALELKASVSGSLIDKLSGVATIYYSPDYNDKEYAVFEGGLAYALPKVWIFDPTVSGQVGYVDWQSAGTDYTYWNAGLSLVVDKLTFDLRYWDSDLGLYSGGAFADDERFVFSATVALP